MPVWMGFEPNSSGIEAGLEVQSRMRLLDGDARARSKPRAARNDPELDLGHVWADAIWILRKACTKTQ